MSQDIVLDVRDLRTYFFTKQGMGKAVDGVSFALRNGETLGLVGESGCGKSMTALSVIRLIPRPAARIVGGEVLFLGEDLLKKAERDMRLYRGRHIAMILQDPMTALNPVFSIGEQLRQPLRTHRHLSGRSLKEAAIDLLELLHIPAAKPRLKDFPHQFSGGMRQRVVGAIALSCEPKVLIADEPTTSLDVTVQAQYLRLLRRIQDERGLSIIFITHDLGVVARMCHRVAVMYAGKIVEQAEVDDLFERPAHPYTQLLLNSVPNLATEGDHLAPIEGQPPSIYNLPSGCPFAPRCPFVLERCRQEYPPQSTVGSNHTADCWRLV